MIERFGHQIVKARKPHRCANCSGTIPAGTLYYRECVSDGGLPQTVKAHPMCAELARTLDYDTDEPWDTDEFRQDAYAYGGPGPFPWESRFYEVSHAE